MNNFLSKTPRIAIIMMAFLSFTLRAQNGNALQGTVKDAEGQPVIGAVVLIQGTSAAAVTDLDGNFSIQAPSTDGTLEISCMGFITQNVAIAGRTVFNVILQEDSTQLEESIVVGYGTIKKKDLTGSVSSIGGQKITERLTPNVATALQGAISGVTVTRSSSAPDSSPTIRIRGITSMTSGASDPYILVDGVPGSLADVNPNDIETITVLKDAASASIYGSQAAAGVILITTKRGDGRTGRNVSYNFTCGFDTPISMPEYANAVDYMIGANEQAYNDNPVGGWFQTYAEDLIMYYDQLHASDPDMYPDEYWVGRVMKNQAFRQSHNLSLKSSKEQNSTVFSVGYDDVDGLYIANKNWKRYTVRLNNDFKVKPWLKASADISLRLVDNMNPHSGPASSMRYEPAVFAAAFSDGRFAPGRNGNNIYAALMNGGEKHDQTYSVTGKFQLDFMPFKGMTVTALFSPKFSFYKEKDFQRQTCYWNYSDKSASTTNYIAQAKTTTLEETRQDTFQHTTQIFANYGVTLGTMHNINAMVGFENFGYRYESIAPKNSSFSHSLVEHITSGNADGFSVSGNINTLARRSFFGRAMYNYGSRYYVQGNIRVDGSSRFAPAYRWGTFVSGSAGWVFTNESFMDGVRSFMNHGKLRVSYGELGNERINSYYPYQVELSSNHAVGYVGDTVTPITGYAQSSAAIENITWETTKTLDFGLDLAFFQNRLSFEADYYYKKTEGMLIKVPIAPILGLSDPYANIGDMYTNGWEINLGWKDQKGDFFYAVNFNLSDDVSVMGYIGGRDTISGGKILREGVEYNSWYGYRADGFYQTQDDLDSRPGIGTVYLGDVIYKNLEDSDPTNPVISPELDREVLGSSLPHFNYGGNINLGWKDLELNVVFQGVGKRNSYLSDEMVLPLRGQIYNIPAIVMEDSWSAKKTDEENLKAKYPRYSWMSKDANYAISDLWMFNGAYFRVKDITLAYSLPEKLVSKAGISGIRLAATLSDFFTISHFPKGWDPEVGVSSYPITKSALFSVGITF